MRIFSISARLNRISRSLKSDSQKISSFVAPAYRHGTDSLPLLAIMISSPRARSPTRFQPDPSAGLGASGSACAAIAAGNSPIKIRIENATLIETQRGVIVDLCLSHTQDHENAKHNQHRNKDVPHRRFPPFPA
jgi:hypothetical protein